LIKEKSPLTYQGKTQHTSIRLTMDDHIIKSDQDGQQVEPNIAHVAQHETVSTTTNMSPPPSRVVPNSSRPSTLQLGGSRMTSSILLTPNDYNKLILSTPELDEKLRGYTIISNTTPTIPLQTPDIINAITAQATGSLGFGADALPSPGAKVLEELLSSQQQQQQQQQNHTDTLNRQYIVVPAEAHQFFQQFTSTNTGEQRLVTSTEQLTQLTQALQQAIAAGTPTGSDGQSQTQLQERILSFLQTRIAPIQQTDDLMTRNRSMSSSMDASINGNDSSNSALSSTDASPIPSHTILLNKVKDEPQHVPNMRSNTSSNSPMDRVNMEQNEVIKKEKKRERNRQAAQKCRTRKLTRIAELQKRVTDLQDKNKDLTDTADRLKTDINRLERQLQEHQTQGCSLTFNPNAL